jgi:hypothetical protein
MTNARISKTAQAVLRNKPLAAAISLALAKNSQASGEDDVIIKINGKTYAIKVVSSHTGQEIKLIARE